MNLIGIDIGGTKCRVSLGRADGSSLSLAASRPARRTADYAPAQMLKALLSDMNELMEQARREEKTAIGISCGGPLDSGAGIILSPPNLPGWDKIPIVDFFEKHTELPAFLCNDANAGALAEWRFGAGRGCNNVVFMTFGTGLGAGLILDGRLYAGACGMAGEIGHIRLAPFGPTGYGKMGSFEGFCSGGGIARLARSMVEEQLQMGLHPSFCPTYAALEGLCAKSVGDAAAAGDPLAVKIYETAGRQLGAGLAILIDILNPECIVIGSIFARNHAELWPAAEQMLAAEALEGPRGLCRVVPSGLGEEIGNYAALAVAQYFHALTENGKGEPPCRRNAHCG